MALSHSSEGMAHRHQIGIEPRPRASDVPEVDVCEYVAVGAAQQHVVLVAIAQPQHEPG